MYTLTSQVQDVTDPQEIKLLLDLLPRELVTNYLEDRINRTEEIVMDLGQPVALRMGDMHVRYADYTIKQVHLDKLQSAIGRFKSDNRSGIEGTCHRISCVRDRYGDVIGITIRVGRVLANVALPLLPLFEKTGSWAIVGPPNVGKTTFLRDAVHHVAGKHGEKVIVVDSADEIGGAGRIPHRYLAPARRFPVPSPEQQPLVLQEAIRNHGATIVILDEIGYHGDVPLVVQAANRGVEVTCSMHGRTIHNVFNNPPMLPLLGIDIETRKKVAPAAFQGLIELRGKGKYYVHENLDDAVNQILATGEAKGKAYGNWGTDSP